MIPVTCMTRVQRERSFVEGGRRAKWEGGVVKQDVTWAWNVFAF